MTKMKIYIQVEKMSDTVDFLHDKVLQAPNENEYVFKERIKPKKFFVALHT